MKTDNQIQQDVIDQLKWEPFLNAAEIGVAVHNGVVTLSGQVDSYLKKLNAERAVRKVAGVKAIAEDIQIRVSSTGKLTDTEIAQAALNALKWHSAVNEDRIHIQVENGIIRLEGEVEWEYQRAAARSAVINLNGVRSVLNLIAIKPRVNAIDLERRIESAFQRHASIDAAKIGVVVNDNKVILNGKVRSFTERDDAEDVAWAAPGVQSVENNLAVTTPELVY